MNFRTGTFTLLLLSPLFLFFFLCCFSSNQRETVMDIQFSRQSLSDGREQPWNKYFVVKLFKVPSEPCQIHFVRCYANWFNPRNIVVLIIAGGRGRRAGWEGGRASAELHRASIPDFIPIPISSPLPPTLHDIFGAECNLKDIHPLNYLPYLFHRLFPSLRVSRCRKYTSKSNA